MPEPTTYEPPGIRARLRSHARERGVAPVAGAALGWGVRYAFGLPRTAVGAPGRFDFAGEQYEYLRHRHRWTWLTERAVEVPIAARAVERYRGRRVLEVGNVLSHYVAVDHPVVDKYEQAPGVINEDMLDFTSPEPFDLVVSVSTVEHVGWDERPRDPERALAAVEHLATLVATGGELVLTFPAGQNPVLDRAVGDGTLEFGDLRGLKRTGRGLRWSEVEPDEALATPYDALLYSAGAVLVARRRS